MLIHDIAITSDQRDVLLWGLSLLRDELLTYPSPRDDDDERRLHGDIDALMRLLQRLRDE